MKQGLMEWREDIHYANFLHFARDRYPCQRFVTQYFLMTLVLCDAQPTASKHRRQPRFAWKLAASLIRVLLGAAEEAGCSRAGRGELQQKGRGAGGAVSRPRISRTLRLGQHPREADGRRGQVPRTAGARGGTTAQTRRDEETV